jgi:hypothetical protein
MQAMAASCSSTVAPKVKACARTEVRRASAASHQQQGKSRRRQRPQALRHRNDQRHHARHIFLDELHLRHQRRQRGRVADADAEQHHARQDQRGLVFRRASQQQRAGYLHRVAHAGHQAAVGIRRHEFADDSAAADGAGRGQRHRQARALGAERRHQQRIQMRDQAGLGEQAQRHRRGQRAKAAVAPQQAARQRLGMCRGDAACRRTWRVTIGLLAHALGRSCDHVRTKASHDGQHGRAHQHGGGGKPHRSDQRAPQRRENHAAQAGAVIGLGQRHGPAAHKPRRDDGVNARRAHGDPAAARQHRGHKQLPGLRG